MEMKSNKSVYIRWVLMRLALVLFDIVAVNAAYFLALVIRFYVNSEFNEWTLKYIPAFFQFAPWYTVCCIVIFVLFRFYDNSWKYAGINDMNRILGACLVTTVVQVAGTMLFVIRMPVTYYCIGAVLQFALITGSRFSYRILQIEFSRIRKLRSKSAIRVMIAGMGDTGHIIRKHLEQDVNNPAKPVCLLDFRGNDLGSMQEGLPLVKGVTGLEAGLKKYGVECVILADTTMPDLIRREIREVCEANGVVVEDFSGYFQDMNGSVPLHRVLEYVSGEVELEMDGKTRHFLNGEEAILSVTGKYLIKKISAAQNRLVIQLEKDILVPNDVNEAWVQAYRNETGEDISFF